MASASSVTITNPRPSPARRPARDRVGTDRTPAMPASASIARAIAPSRPCGASTSARSETVVALHAPSRFMQSRRRRPARHAAQHALEVRERLADVMPRLSIVIFADRVLVRPGPLLDDRDRAAHPPERLEIAQQDHGVGQIGDVDRRLACRRPGHAARRSGRSWRPGGSDIAAARACAGSAPAPPASPPGSR